MAGQGPPHGHPPFGRGVPHGHPLPPTSSGRPRWAGPGVSNTDAIFSSGGRTSAASFSSPFPSSRPSTSGSGDMPDDISQATKEQRVEYLKDVGNANVGPAREAVVDVVSRAARGGTRKGWCVISQMAATKDSLGEDKYIQISAWGINKVMTLQEALIILKGSWSMYERSAGDQISHKCHQRKCTTPGHVCIESAQQNNNRKGCGILTDCPCGSRSGILILCPHFPLCVPAWIPNGYAHVHSWEEFVANANICHHVFKNNQGMNETRVGRPQGRLL